MDLVPKLSLGDRVRVVLEGNANPVTGSSAFWVDGSNIIYPDKPHVVSIEVLPKPIQVGDNVEGYQCWALPAGSAVLYEPGGGVLLRTRHGWRNTSDAAHPPDRGAVYKVLHVGQYVVDIESS